jgi:hypothetical protein
MVLLADDDVESQNLLTSLAIDDRLFFESKKAGTNKISREQTEHDSHILGT